jgi:hypothetical protein
MVEITAGDDFFVAVAIPGSELAAELCVAGESVTLFFVDDFGDLGDFFRRLAGVLGEVEFLFPVEAVVISIGAFRDHVGNPGRWWRRPRR